MTDIHGANGAQRRARAEALLARYPAIEPPEVDELVRWFRKEATALEVALLASEPSIAQPYRQFTAEHIDRLTPLELLVAALFVLGGVAVVLLLVSRG